VKKNGLSEKKPTEGNGLFTEGIKKIYRIVYLAGLPEALEKTFRHS
jgi:hypothetical protein